MTLFRNHHCGQTAVYKLLLICSIFILGSAYVTTHPEFSQATNDDVIVVMNSNVVFDALENDNIGKLIPDIGIINQPTHGTVKLNDDHSFTYTPTHGVCEYVDSFLYFIAKDGNYDKATVYVDILCEPLTFISGFSPNDDSKYNSFTVLGIENYPHNSMHIFDKWGTEIYYTPTYQNDWKGMVDGLAPKEDIFYYVFMDGLGNMYSGYVQVSMDDEEE